MAYPNFYTPNNQFWASAPAQMPVQQPQQQNGMIWVQGEAGAKAYPVQPGATLWMMDSEGEYFYVKSADASGIPQPLRKFSFKEIQIGEEAKIDSDKYVTREEFDRKISELMNRRNYNKNNYQRGDRNNE